MEALLVQKNLRQPATWSEPAHTEQVRCNSCARRQYLRSCSAQQEAHCAKEDQHGSHGPHLCTHTVSLRSVTRLQHNSCDRKQTILAAGSCRPGAHCHMSLYARAGVWLPEAGQA